MFAGASTNTPLPVLILSVLKTKKQRPRKSETVAFGVPERIRYAAAAATRPRARQPFTERLPFCTAKPPFSNPPVSYETKNKE